MTRIPGGALTKDGKARPPPFEELALPKNGANIDTMKLAEILKAMRDNPGNVRFADAVKVATHHFGDPRQKGTSHCVWKMPWPGDPRVNLQNKGGKAKPYQVRQLLAAIDKKESEQ